MWLENLAPRHKRLQITLTAVNSSLLWQGAKFPSPVILQFPSSSYSECSAKIDRFYLLEILVENRREDIQIIFDAHFLSGNTSQRQRVD